MLLAWCLAATFAGVSAVHVYWAAGGRLGVEAAIPELDGKPLFRPGRAATLAVAVLLMIAGLLILGRAGRARASSPRS